MATGDAAAWVAFAKDRIDPIRAAAEAVEGVQLPPRVGVVPAPPNALGDDADAEEGGEQDDSQHGP